MQVKLIGVQDVNYTSKKTNQQVTGVTLYYTFPDNKTVGEQSGNCYVSDNFMNSLGVLPKQLIEQVGASVNIDFNQKGYLCGLTFAEKSVQVVPPHSNPSKFPKEAS